MPPRAYGLALALVPALMFGCHEGSGATTSSSSSSSSSSQSGGTTPASGTDSSGDTSDTPRCGDGLVQPPEACDDGNAIEGDRCNNSCQISGAMVWCKYEIGEDGGPNAGYAIALDSHGDAIVVGIATNQKPDQGRGFAAKYTRDGTLAWFHNFPGSFNANGVVVDASDQITVAIRLEEGNSLVRLDSSGEVTWQRVVSENVAFESNNLALSSAGEIAIMGSALTQPFRAWIAGVSSDGEITWQHTMDDILPQTQPYALAADQDGNWLLAGTVLTMLSGGGGDIEPFSLTDGFVRKLSPTGEPIWTQTLAPQGDDATLTLVGIAQDTSQHIRVVGNVGQPLETRAMHAVLTADGATIRQADFDIPGQSSFVTGMIAATHDDILVLGWLKRPGDKNSSGHVTRARADGTLTWTYSNDLVLNKFSPFSAAAQRGGGPLFVIGYQNTQMTGEPRALVCRLEP